MAATTPTLMAVNRVPAHRAGDFERIIRERIAPALRAVRPELADHWQMLRASTEEEVAVFVFLSHAGDESQWLLEPILVEACGEEEARALLAALEDLLLDTQTAWPLTPVEV